MSASLTYSTAPARTAPERRHPTQLASVCTILPLLPWPAAFDFELEQEAKGRPEEDDEAKHREVG